MALRVIFLICILFYPVEAWARYGRSSNGGWWFFIALLVICTLLVIYGAAAANEEKKAKERYESILNSKKRELEREAIRQRNEIEKEGNILKNSIIRSFSNRELEIQKKEHIIEKRERELENKLLLQEKLFEEKTKGFPWVAEAYSRTATQKFDLLVNYLLTKKNPSPKSADIVREMKSLIKNLEKELFIHKGVIEYYTALFPWLKEFLEAPDEAIQLTPRASSETEEDAAKEYLTDAEWNSLSRSEKFQVALDRYWQRHKSNWEIGRAFERYIGYCYEKEGWEVEFVGAIKRLEDMGRDLICKKNGELQIVQCKYWASEKVIHEKHIFQLFGSCVQYSIEHNVQPLGVFVTSCSLSETAKKCASYLGINFSENIVMEKFPCIKCNIGSGGEKIYHLPFDQMYDRVKITPKKGEVYCSTIAEAEALGFRRAFRWHGGP